MSGASRSCCDNIPPNVAPRATRPGTISLSAASTTSATIGAAPGAARLHAATPAHAARTIANVIRQSVTAAASLRACRQCQSHAGVPDARFPPS
jgi:hypothetical protein